MEADESTETVLAEGESRLVDRWGRGGTAGDKLFPLPKTLPLPSFRDDIVPQNVGSPYVGPLVEALREQMQRHSGSRESNAGVWPKGFSQLSITTMLSCLCVRKE